MQPHNLLLKFAPAWATISSNDISVVQRLCEVSRFLLMEIAKQFISSRQTQPIMMSVSVDGTPLMTRERWANSAGPSSVRRSGGCSHEFLVGRCFLRDSAGNRAVLFREPISLGAGKTSWHLWSACRSICRTSREYEHKSISISHYCFDRGIHSSLTGIMQSTHALVAKLQLSHTSDDPMDQILGLQDWVVDTACCCHDAHNAAKWSVAPLTENLKQTNRDLFISIVSVRNAYDLLVQEMGPWLAKTLVFSDDGMVDAHAVWTVLGVESSWVDELVLLQLHYKNGLLHIASSARRY